MGAGVETSRVAVGGPWSEATTTMRGHRLGVQLKAGLHNTDADCIVLRVPDRACLLGLEIDPPIYSTDEKSGLVRQTSPLDHPLLLLRHAPEVHLPPTWSATLSGRSPLSARPSYPRP